MADSPFGLKIDLEGECKFKRVITDITTARCGCWAQI